MTRTSPSRSRPSSSKVIRSETARDGRTTHYVNGQPVITYEHPTIGGGQVNNDDPAVKKDGTPLIEGYISLQSESHPIEFRKVEIMDLSKQ